MNQCKTSNYLGQVSAGSENTASAGEEILQEGGNAFDAIIASFFAACVCEPILSSLAGGGYMMANTPEKKHPELYDFFCQSPMNKKSIEKVDFFSVLIDFGVSQQEFHIGRGSIATPGSVAGIFKIHKNLASLPMKRLIEPAIRFARKGFKICDFQTYLFSLVHPIYSIDKATVKYYQTSRQKNCLVQKGDLLLQPDLANTLEILAYEGRDCFYQGEIAQKIIKMCKENGGHLKSEDLRNYQVKIRKPLRVKYKNSQIYLNPAPSMGGSLVAFALKLLEDLDFQSVKWHSREHIRLLSEIMKQTNHAKIEKLIHPSNKNFNTIFEPKLIKSYQNKILNRNRFMRGTTHISTQDCLGNQAAMTLSNGEGCGYMLTGTGIMMNNILGEEDLNPKGFHEWNENERMASMMCPSILKNNNQEIAFGSGGSNRIRTAILQVIHNLVDFNHSLEKSINLPRIHLEEDLLNIENTKEFHHKNNMLKELSNYYPNYKNWSNPNMFFGGVHAVSKSQNQFTGVGDMRRNGVSKTVLKPI